MKTIDYNKQAEDFLRKTKTTFKAEYLKTGKYFTDDKEERDIYKITLTRKEREYSFNFGQSLNDSGYKVRLCSNNEVIVSKTRNQINEELKRKNQKKITPSIIWKHFVYGTDYIEEPKAPNAYDVLACLTKYEVGTFEDFCADFGYDTDSRKSEKIYKAVCDEWMNIQRLFSDEEIELLREMQ